MQNQEAARQKEGKDREGENAMSPSAPPLQVGCWAGEIGQNIEIREVGSNDEGRSAERGSSAELRPGQSSPHEGMADGVYSSLASISSCTFPCKALETGHPFFAASAALLKPA